MEGVEEPASFKDVEMYIPPSTPESTSRLFQVRLTPEEVLRFTTPSTQPLKDPANCAIVSARLLGLLSKVECEMLTAYHKDGLTTDELTTLIAHIHTGYNIPIVPRLRIMKTLEQLASQLFDGFATLVLLKFGDRPGGHVFVLAKHNAQLYVLDPQSKEVFTGVPNIQAYFRQTSNGRIEFLLGFIYRSKYTPSQLINLYAPVKRAGRSRKIQKRRKRKTRRRHKSTPSF